MRQRVLFAFVVAINEVHPRLDGIVCVFEFLLVNDAALVHRCGRFNIGALPLLFRARKPLQKLFGRGQLPSCPQQVSGSHLLGHIFNDTETGGQLSASAPIVLQKSVSPKVKEVPLSGIAQPGVVGPKCRFTSRHGQALFPGLFGQPFRFFCLGLLLQPQPLDDVLHPSVPVAFIQITELPQAVISNDDRQLLHQLSQTARVVSDLRIPRMVFIHVGQGAVVVSLRQLILTVFQMQVRQTQEALHSGPSVPRVFGKGVPQEVHALLAVQLFQLNLSQRVKNLISVFLVFVVLQHIEEQLLDLFTVSTASVKSQRLLHAGLELHLIRGLQLDNVVEQLNGLAVASIFPLELSQDKQWACPVSLWLDHGDGPFQRTHRLLNVALREIELGLNHKCLCPQFIRGVALPDRLEQSRIGLGHVFHGHVSPRQPCPRRHLTVWFLVCPLQILEYLLCLREVPFVEVALSNEGVVVVNPPVELRALEVFLCAPRRGHGVSVHNTRALFYGPFHQRVQEVRLVLGAHQKQGNHLVPILLVRLGQLLIGLLHGKPRKVKTIESGRGVVIGPIEPPVPLGGATSQEKKQGQHAQLIQHRANAIP